MTPSDDEMMLAEFLAGTDRWAAMFPDERKQAAESAKDLASRLGSTPETIFDGTPTKKFYERFLKTGKTL
jgi:hypothetical protein